jgi:hypothetical protein
MWCVLPTFIEFGIRGYFGQGDPTKRPTIEFVNRKDKGMRIMRGEVQIDINPSATHELQDGDVVTIVSGGSIM